MKMYRKNNQKKRMVLLCLLCLAGILACGCKAGDGSADSAAGGTASGGSDNGAGNTASEKGTNRRAKGQEDKDAMPKGGTEPDLEGQRLHRWFRISGQRLEISLYCWLYTGGTVFHCGLPG